MIKVKIIKENKFFYNVRPITFKAILKNKKERIVGSIKFNFIMENVEVDFRRRLSYYEKLAVLKSIFYLISYLTLFVILPYYHEFPLVIL